MGRNVPDFGRQRRPPANNVGNVDSTTVLEAVGIGRKVGDRWLLEDVSLTIRPGERIGVIGPSGSGKTLLLRALALLDSTDAGEIRWLGEVVHGAGVPHFRSQVMYLHQRPVLLEGTVEDNLRAPFHLRVHRDITFDRERVVALLETLSRDGSFLAKQQRDLSGGESQIAALLRAMQLDPAVLLLDEPTAALDADATAQVEALVSGWLGGRPERRAVVWVTHDLQQARRVATRVLRMDKGRLTGECDG